MMTADTKFLLKDVNIAHTYVVGISLEGRIFMELFAINFP
jgi:hypothetical protein